jgi:uncharacterized RDD family membrane protein YckC
MNYASFSSRFWASLIDGILTGVVGLFVGFVIGFALGIVIGGSGGDAANQSLLEVIGNIIGIIIAWLYGAVMESSSRQATFGKIICGIKVTDLNGDPISFGKASARHFSKIYFRTYRFNGVLDGRFYGKEPSAS